MDCGVHVAAGEELEVDELGDGGYAKRPLLQLNDFSQCTFDILWYSRVHRREVAVGTAPQRSPLAQDRTQKIRVVTGVLQRVSTES